MYDKEEDVDNSIETINNNDEELNSLKNENQELKDKLIKKDEQINVYEDKLLKMQQQLNEQLDKERNYKNSLLINNYNIVIFKILLQ